MLTKDQCGRGTSVAGNRSREASRNPGPTFTRRRGRAIPRARALRSRIWSSRFQPPDSSLCLILIDTPAIRISSISFRISVHNRSNRHTFGGVNSAFLRPIGIHLESIQLRSWESERWSRSHGIPACRKLHRSPETGPLVSSVQPPESNRQPPELETAVTHSKQRTATRSNRQLLELLQSASSGTRPMESSRTWMEGGRGDE